MRDILDIDKNRNDIYTAKNASSESISQKESEQKP